MSFRWIPIDTTYFLSNYNTLDAEEFGALMLLTMEYWQAGSLPDDDRALAVIAKVSYRRWGKMRPHIAQYFEPNWRSPYLDDLLKTTRQNYSKAIAYFKTLDERRPSPLEWMEIRTRIFARDDYTCVYCGQRGGALQCDHVVPIARGGSNDDANLATACESCNKSKGTKLVSEWRS